jgi:hypothetical protein
MTKLKTKIQNKRIYLKSIAAAGLPLALISSCATGTPSTNIEIQMNKAPTDISFSEISRIRQSAQNIDNLSLATIKKVFAFSDSLDQIIVEGLEVRKVPGGPSNDPGNYQLELLAKEGFVINDVESVMLSNTFSVVPDYKVSSYSTEVITNKQILDASIKEISDTPGAIDRPKFNIIENVFNFGTIDPEDVMKDLQINKTIEPGPENYSLTLTAKPGVTILGKSELKSEIFRSHSIKLIDVEISQIEGDLHLSHEEIMEITEDPKPIGFDNADVVQKIFS